MTWSIHVGTVGGVAVRVHALFLLYIVIELLRSVSPPLQGSSSLGFRPSAAAMGILVVLVLAHEFGHCLVCRLTRGVATEVLLWPLGGLAACRPENRWRAHLATALGGPAVNILICLTAGGMLWANTGRVWEVAAPNLIDPLAILDDAQLNLAGSWPLLLLFLVNLVSVLLLVFNLLPMFPLDGGRILQAVLWPHLGYANAMRLAVRLGIVVAAVLFVYGAVRPSIHAVAVALFGAFVSWTTHRQLEFTESVIGYDAGPHEFDQAIESAEDARLSSSRLDQSSAEDEFDSGESGDDSIRKEEVELDRILQKIGRTGAESLSAEELAMLEEATRRRRERRE